MGEQLYVVSEMSSADTIPCDSVHYDPYHRHQASSGHESDNGVTSDQEHRSQPGMLTLLSLFCVIAILGTLAVVMVIFRQNRRVR